MQIQMNIAAPANATQAGSASGGNANAGDASFSQLLSRAAPRDSAAASSTERKTVAAEQRSCEHAAAGDAARGQATDAQDDEAPDLIAHPQAQGVAAMPDATAAAPAAESVAAQPVALVDTLLASALSPVAATNDAHSAPAAGDALVDPAAARAVQAQPVGALAGAATAPTAGAVQRKPVDFAAKDFAAGLAQSGAHEAQRSAEAAVAAQPLRTVRANDAQPLLVDLNIPAASLAATSAPLASTVPAAAPASTAATSLQLPHPVDSSAFAPALALTLTRLARDGVQEARLQLHPAEMGPIDVRIAVDGTQARIDFSADVAATRAAIEAGLPTLAGALRESGLTLAGGSVFQHARNRRDDGTGDGYTHREQGADDAGATGAPAAPHRVMRGVVDLYA